MVRKVRRETVLISAVARVLARFGALIVVLCGMMLLGVSPGAHLDALNAAGAFKGNEIAGVAHYFDALKGNLVWLGITVAGFVAAVIAIMFLAGHSRAHDAAIKTIVGLAILASISGIVA